jgi:hypothetical protein
MSSFSPIPLALCGLALSTACIGVSQSGGGNEPAESPATVQQRAKLNPCKAGTKPADDGLMDDFEDGDRQLMKVAGREGYWWKHADPNGSKFSPDELTLEDAGAGSTGKALHAAGQTASTDGAYGVRVGVNFTAGGLYDASTYVGISFKAKVDANATKSLRFEIGDVNTHKDAGVCVDCWNHFGKDLQLTTEWKEYVILFADVTQQAGWGKPRPPSVSPDKLYAIDWSIGPGAIFGLWLDDVQLLTCK